MLQLLVKDAVTYRPGHVAAAFALLLGRSLVEGFGLVLLIPLLGIVGFGDASFGDSRIGQAASRLIEWLGGTPSLTTVLTIFVVVITIRAILGYGFTVVSSQLREGYVAHLRCRLFDALVRANWAMLSSLARSDLITVLIGHTDRMTASTYSLISLISAIVTTVVVLAVAAHISPVVTLVVAGVAVAVGAALSPFDRRARRLGHRHAEVTRELYGRFSNQLDGMKPAKSAGAEERLSASFRDIASSYGGAAAEIDRNSARARLAREFAAGAILVVFVLLVVAVQDAPSIEPIVLVIIFARLFAPAGEIQRSYQDIAASLPAFGRIRELETAARNAAEPETSPVSPIGLEREIRLEAGSLAYDGEDGSIALKDVNAVIVAGEITALVGRSGAGKSSLAEIVAGLRLPTQGRLTIDGTPLDDRTIRGWRVSVGYVPQENYLFNDTIRANLLWVRPDATEAAIWRALETANAAHFVRNLPEGLDTVLRDQGTRLSGGERQRIALARALLREPALLVMDEATNALGPEDEKLLVEALEALRGTTTILLIAHRLSAVACADSILALDHGRLVEKGTWSELSKKPQGRFRAMLDAAELP